MSWDCIRKPRQVAAILARDHYLGPVRSNRGFAWHDELGVVVLARPTSRRLPVEWLELVRWCLVGVENGGTRQWARVSGWIRERMPEVSTVVSYSDPSAGHDGALYRACNWLWAPTWHRLRPPPTGNGDWGSGGQAVKDRWIFPIRPDSQRSEVLSLASDPSLRARMPWAEYREPRWKRGRRTGGGGNFKRFQMERPL